MCTLCLVYLQKLQHVSVYQRKEKEVGEKSMKGSTALGDFSKQQSLWQIVIFDIRGSEELDISPPV